MVNIWFQTGRRNHVRLGIYSVRSPCLRQFPLTLRSDFGINFGDRMETALEFRARDRPCGNRFPRISFALKTSVGPLKSIDFYPPLRISRSVILAKGKWVICD